MRSTDLGRARVCADSLEDEPAQRALARATENSMMLSSFALTSCDRS